jgi:hypothetical protein
MGRKCQNAGTVHFLTNSTPKHLPKNPRIDDWHLGTNALPTLLQQMYQNLFTKNEPRQQPDAEKPAV